MILSFHGAARGVTGSCHRVRCGRRNVLVDCGLYQGAQDIDEANEAPFGFDAAAVDQVLLTHAHLDHCGRLPLLYKRGFRGEIIATAATRDLASIVLLDAARLQTDEFEYKSQRPRRHGTPVPDAPLYGVQDAYATMRLFGRIARYGVPLDVAPGIRATFVDAGHILGSASVHVEAEGQGRRASVVFSGDIGNSGRPLLRDPATPPPADALVMETTYGDRLHRPLDASVEELFDAIEQTFERGGNVVIPTFALERAQEVLFHLRVGIERGRIPRMTPIYLDSPMGISATEIFRRHAECYDEHTAALFRAGNDPLSTAGLRLTRSPQESELIDRVKKGAIILAGSGMATGGRVRYHLRRLLPREDCSVVFVGFAAHGTPARRIIDGAKTVRLLGDDVPVRARVFTINGFSAHADQLELLEWQRKIAAPKTFLVHGEELAMRKFAQRLEGTSVFMPMPGEEFEL